VFTCLLAMFIMWQSGDKIGYLRPAHVSVSTPVSVIHSTDATRYVAHSFTATSSIGYAPVMNPEHRIPPVHVAR
jgi:hypothetical protein